MSDTPRFARGSSRFPTWAAVAATVLFSAHAMASPMYPGAVASEVKALTGLDMPCTPSCTLCHGDLQGGRGTVNKPFGSSMMKNGLTLQDPAGVVRALAALKANAVDSDGDGATDVDELGHGDDPDVVGSGQLCGQSPRYGCGARVARANPSDRPRPGDIVPVWAALIAFFAIARRRRPA